MRLEKILPFFLFIFVQTLFIIGETYGNIIDEDAQIVLSAIIIGSLFIWQIKTNKNYQSRRLIPTPAVFILFLIPAAASFSSLFSTSQYRSLLSAIFTNTVFFAALVSSSDKVIKKYYPLFIIFIAGIFAVYGIYDYVNQYPSTFPPHVLRAPWNNRFLAAEFLLPIFYISSFYYTKTKNRYIRFMFGILSALFIIASLLTRDWQQILLNSVLMILMLYYLKISSLKFAKELISLVLIVLILTIYLMPQIGREIVSPDTLRTIAQLKLIDRSEVLYFIEQTLQQKPMLGFGPGTAAQTITYLQRLPWIRSSVLHNQPATLIIEQGLLGFLVWMIFAGYLLYWFTKTRTHPASSKSLGLRFAVLIFLLANSSFGLSYYSKSTTITFWVLLGILLGQYGIGKKRDFTFARNILGGAAIILIIMSAIVFTHVIRINNLRRKLLLQETFTNSWFSHLPDLITSDPKYYLLASYAEKNPAQKVFLLKKGEAIDPTNPEFIFEIASIETNNSSTLWQSVIATYPFYSPKPYLKLAEKYMGEKKIELVRNVLITGAVNFPVNSDYYTNKLLLNLAGTTRSLALLNLYTSQVYPHNKISATHALNIDPLATTSASFIRFQRLYNTD